jgi:protein subunit release factor A
VPGTGGARHWVYAVPTAAIDQLVDELERSYKETQERLSDPAVYNDHTEAAQVGRRLKELETPYKLPEEWKQVSADLTDARGDKGRGGVDCRGLPTRGQ